MPFREWHGSQPEHDHDQPAQEGGDRRGGSHRDHLRPRKLGLSDERIHALILGYWHTIVTPPMVFARNVVEVKKEMEAKGFVKPIVASLAGDVEVEEAAEYLYQNGIPSYAYSTELPVEVLGAKYKWARGAGLL